ncbi:MAG: hypothetical protein KatS3mg033_2115 [Thermonema sp.]|nr:hypothetical protein [Thermonema sp.]GIV40315.1 MAG: hypothetical protein KatS3mg033_2115 [Thermonema sp.]
MWQKMPTKSMHIMGFGPHAYAAIIGYANLAIDAAETAVGRW